MVICTGCILLYKQKSKKKLDKMKYRNAVKWSIIEAQGTLAVGPGFLLVNSLGIQFTQCLTNSILVLILKPH